MIFHPMEKGHVVKKSRFTEEQIAFALKQAELGTKVDEICRKMGISDATFYKWRQKYGGLGPSELRRLRQLEEENNKLKRLVADLSLDKAMLQDVLSKKCWRRSNIDHLCRLNIDQGTWASGEAAGCG